MVGSSNSLSAVKNACEDADVSVQKELLLETSDKLSEMKVALAELKDVKKGFTHHCYSVGKSFSSFTFFRDLWSVLL